MEFRLFQLEDRLQRLTNKVQTTLLDEILKEAEAILHPKIILQVNNKIDEFYKAAELNKH